uniref:Uncharacterized protein n=1 Tax=Panagrolaimus superbus TaxID=310955 RepID=A0A914Y348_9BILA
MDSKKAMVKAVEEQENKTESLTDKVKQALDTLADKIVPDAERNNNTKIMAEMNPRGAEIYEHGYATSVGGGNETLPHEAKKGGGLMNTIKENVKTITDAVTGNADPHGDEYLPANDATAALKNQDRAAPIEGHQEMRQERNHDHAKDESCSEAKGQKSCLGLSCHTAQ